MGDKIETLFNLAVIRHASRKHLSRKQVMEEHDFFKQFRIVLFKNNIFINEKSRFPFVFASCNFNDLLNSIQLIDEYCGDKKILCHGGYDKFPIEYYRNLDLLKPHFKSVFLEHYKFHNDYMKVLPQAFNYGYMQQYNADVFGKMVNCSFDIQKEKVIGTAFGKKWPKLSRQIKDRVNLLESVEHGNLIENFFCDISRYHYEKSKYLYFASPLGAGLQSTKIYESFMCETIPVLTDAPYARQLRDYHNLPIHIVDSWEHLNENHLIEAYETEYKNYDWCSLKKRFYVDNFINEFLKF